MKTIKLHKIDRTVDVDYDAFTPEVKDFVVNYGLTQILNDAMSGVKVGRGGTATDEQVAEGLDLASKRLNALAEGKLRQRTASPKTPVDPVAKRALEIAEARVRASDKFKAWVVANSPTVKEANAAARTKAEQFAPQFMDEARKQIEAERKAAEKLGIDDELDFDDIELVSATESEAA